LPTVSFDQPYYLLGLLLLPLFWLAARFSLTSLDPLRRLIAILLRSLLVTSLILALSGINIVRRSASQCVLFVLDCSSSVARNDRLKELDLVNNAAGAMQGRDRIGVLTVAGETRLAFAPTEKGVVKADLSAPDSGQTNLSRGIASALSYFPDDAAKRIVLISDGNETAGSAVEAARSAAADDVPVDTISIGSAPDNETLLSRMLTPPNAKRGEPFPVQILAESRRGGKGVVTLYRNGVAVGRQPVDLRPGKNQITMTQQADAPGFYTYEARLTLPQNEDTFEENNRAASFVRVEGKPRVLLVHPASAPDIIPETFLPQALAAQNVDVIEMTPNQMPQQAAGLLNYDGIILSDVPAESLTATQQKLIQAAVHDLGLGLIMIGGAKSFGAGGYYQTPIEETLPVEMDIRKMRRLPGVALAMAIDYSGSMNMTTQRGTGQSKLELAQEAAHRSVDALSPQDQVGVLAVDTQANIVVPLQYVTNKKDIHAGIGAIYGGGGTEMSAAVRGCYEMLAKADAKVKHAILVTDGETGPYDYGDLIEAMQEKKITFSLVLIDEGQADAGILPLKRIADRTGGRFYRVRDAAEIPKIYLREVQTISRPPVVEEPFTPRIATVSSPLLTGLPLDNVPPLLGYDVVVARPTAEVALSSHKGDPVLATWRYGLGKSVAFTSDARARWGAQWVTWNGYPPFWAQIIRWSLRRSETGSYQSGIDRDGAKARLTLDAVDDKTGGFVNFLEAKGKVVGPDGNVQTLRLSQTAPGRYVGTFDAPKVGSYIATVSTVAPSGVGRVTTTGLSVPYSPEYAALSPDTALLARITEISGGKVLTDAENVFRERRTRSLPFPLALSLLGLALLLLPFDIANRRLAWTDGQLANLATAFREKWGERALQRQAARSTTRNASVTRLRERKAQLEAEDAEAQKPTPIPSPVRGGSGVTGGNAPPSAPTSPSGDKPASGASSSSDYRSRLLDAKRRAAQEED
jgi:uncharacterized membrane protein